MRTLNASIWMTLAVMVFCSSFTVCAEDGKKPDNVFGVELKKPKGQEDTTYVKDGHLTQEAKDFLAVYRVKVNMVGRDTEMGEKKLAVDKAVTEAMFAKEDPTLADMKADYVILKEWRMARSGQSRGYSGYPEYRDNNESVYNRLQRLILKRCDKAKTPDELVMACKEIGESGFLDDCYDQFPTIKIIDAFLAKDPYAKAPNAQKLAFVKDWFLPRLPAVIKAALKNNIYSSPREMTIL